MIANQNELSDAQLEELLLSGARGLHAPTPSLRAHQAPRYLGTSERRVVALDSLLACAREISRRRRIRDFQHEAVTMTEPDRAAKLLVEHFDGHECEVFVVLFLNAQHRLLAVEEMFRGTLSQTVVYAREVVKRALALNAGAVILAHNHPSGVCEPSRADEHLTTTLKNSLALVDIRVLDHLIVGRTEVVSFAERGLL